MNHSRSQQYVYILSCAKDGGVYSYTFNEKRQLVLRDRYSLDRPMYGLRVGNRLSVLLRAPFPTGDDSGLVTVETQDGRFSGCSAIASTRGTVACHLCVTHGRTYAANYLSGSVIALPDILAVHSGSSVHPSRQSAPHAHFIGPTYDDRYLCAVDLGLDKIFVYDSDLQRISETSLHPGDGPRHIVFSADGRYVYCANELSSTVAVLRYTDGQLTLLREYPTIPAGFNGQNAPAAIRFARGNVYVSNRGHNSIARFRAMDDTLSLTGIFPCGGDSPRDFNLCGDTIICANEASDTVTVLDMSGDTMEPIQEIAIEKPNCVFF